MKFALQNSLFNLKIDDFFNLISITIVFFQMRAVFVASLCLLVGVALGHPRLFKRDAPGLISSFFYHYFSILLSRFESPKDIGGTGKE